MAESEARDFQLLNFFFFNDCTQFFILAQGHPPFHLYALETTSNPALCRQTEFVYNLKIVH